MHKRVDTQELENRRVFVVVESKSEIALKPSPFPPSLSLSLASLWPCGCGVPAVVSLARGLGSVLSIQNRIGLGRNWEIEKGRDGQKREGECSSGEKLLECGGRAMGGGLKWRDMEIRGAFLLIILAPLLLECLQAVVADSFILGCGGFVEVKKNPPSLLLLTRNGLVL